MASHWRVVHCGTPALCLWYHISDVFPSSELGVLARFLPPLRRMQNEEAELKPQATSVIIVIYLRLLHRSVRLISTCGLGRILMLPMEKTKNVGGNISLPVQGLLSICDV